MFDSEFYPTPLDLIQKLISPYRIKQDDEKYKYGFKLDPDWTILEPSAGKGDIADYICDYNKDSYGRKRNDARVRVIEQNFELQQILMGKGYPVIGSDFLSYEADQHFDLILMNPPFSNGDLHLLHAWDVIGSGGKIACVLNSETVNNPYTKRRKDLLQLINEHGSIEYVCKSFIKAERKTNVEICIVRLNKPVLENDRLDFKFDLADKEEAEIEYGMSESTCGGLARIDHLGSIINQYEKTKEAFINFVKAMEELCFYGSDIAEKYTTHTRFDLMLPYVQRMALDAYNNGRSNKSKCNEFRDRLNLSAWKLVLSKLNIEGMMTSNLQKEFASNVDKVGHLPLTKENVSAVVGAIIDNSQETMKKAVVDVFDIFTKYHSENRIPNQEGWKTNKSWRCTKKVILPNWVELGFMNGMRIKYEKSSHYQDIDKACCWLSGKRYGDIVTIEKAMQEDMNTKGLGSGESEFFFFRYFKKGTVHLTFKDQDLLDKFNRIASDNKNWLGDGT